MFEEFEPVGCLVVIFIAACILFAIKYALGG